MTTRIHSTGASGSATTTLGRSLAASIGCPHFDTDDYFWLPTNPPFQQRRPSPERDTMLGEDLAHYPAWVLSGAVGMWGDGFIPLLDLVIFLWVPPAARLARLAERARPRFGEAALTPAA